MSSSNTLDKTSSTAFLLGLIASRIQLFLSATLMPYVNILSLSFYLIGYMSWFALNYFFPDKTKTGEPWSAFAQFKVQHILAAMIGIIATGFSFAAITMPVLLIPAGWLFVCSNTFWSIGEYHKYKNPPENSTVSQSYQENYLKFAVTMTGMGLVSALAVTLSFVFPPLGLSILVTSAVINIGLGFMVLEYWLKCTFETSDKTKGNTVELSNLAHSSYTDVAKTLNNTAPAASHSHERDIPCHTPTPGRAQTPQPPAAKKSDSLPRSLSTPPELRESQLDLITAPTLHVIPSTARDLSVSTMPHSGDPSLCSG